jgi:hypothetical protein
VPSTSATIYRASRKAVNRQPGPEASGHLRDPESPTLTVPPSLPTVRVGTLHESQPYRAGAARYGTFIESSDYLAHNVTLRAFGPRSGKRDGTCRAESPPGVVCPS